MKVQGSKGDAKQGKKTCNVKGQEFDAFLRAQLNS